VKPGKTARSAGADELTDLACACATARQVARALTQLYDRWLIGTGLEAPQFALLMTLDKHGAVSQAALGRRYALDKTTMSRNLKLFERDLVGPQEAVGMRVLGMQVGNAFDGKTLTTDQALRRAVALWGPGTIAQFFNGLPAIGSILGLLALLWGIYLLYTTAQSPTKQGFHDTFANTVVVKASRSV